MIQYRNTEYYKKSAEVYGITEEKLNKDMRNLKKFRAKVFKNQN